MTWRHIKAIAYKEFLHILRDPGTLLLVTLGPVFLMVSFTYTMTADVKNAAVAVLDRADNVASAELLVQFKSTDVIDITHEVDSQAEADDLMQKGAIVALVIIPADYGELGLDGSMTPVSAVIDGTEPVSAEAVLDEVYRISDEYSRELASTQLAEMGLDATLFDPPIRIKEKILYNPELRSVVDIYPGLAAMMLSLPAIALALSFARENEAGTLEQLVASPINKRALLIGKMMPYLVFGMVDVYILLVLGWVAYDVPFEGSLIDYTIIALLFMVANLGVGMLIAVLIRSQQVAIIVTMLIFFVPPFFLSGLFFPVSAMPEIMQWETVEFPSTHYVAASRAIQLQGSSLRSLWFPTLILLILAVELLEVAAWIFRKKVIMTFSFKKLLGRKEVSA